MTHDLINYQHEKNSHLVNQLCQQLAMLGSSAKIAGSYVQDSVNNLSAKMEMFSKSSDKQSKRMYLLTWIIAGSSILNVLAIIFQTYHK